MTSGFQHHMIRTRYILPCSPFNLCSIGYCHVFHFQSTTYSLFHIWEIVILVGPTFNMGNSTIQLSIWEKLDFLPAIIQSRKPSTSYRRSDPPFFIHHSHIHSRFHPRLRHPLPVLQPQHSHGLYLQAPRDHLPHDLCVWTTLHTAATVRIFPYLPLL